MIIECIHAIFALVYLCILISVVWHWGYLEPPAVKYLIIFIYFLSRSSEDLLLPLSQNLIVFLDDLSQLLPADKQDYALSKVWLALPVQGISLQGCFVAFRINYFILCSCLLGNLMGIFASVGCCLLSSCCWSISTGVMDIRHGCGEEFTSFSIFVEAENKTQTMV